MTEMKLTMGRARADLRALGLVLKRTAAGDLPVNYRGGYEGSAYYTNDRPDALDTGRDMAERRELCK